jgi:transposase
MSSSSTTSPATKARPPAPASAQKAHLFFLPPYSPDLNPIEQMFAKLKHLIRKAQPRDLEATWRKVGQLLDLFSPAECANYLANSGYRSV